MREDMFKKLREECLIANNVALMAMDEYRAAGLAYYEEQKDRMKLAEIAAIIGITPTTLTKWRKRSGFETKKAVGNIGGRAYERLK